jgi:hypothetical protein
VSGCANPDKNGGRYDPAAEVDKMKGAPAGPLASRDDGSGGQKNGSSSWLPWGADD